MNGELEKLSGKFDDEIPGGVAENLGNFEFSGKKIMNLSVGSENVGGSLSKEGRKRFKQGRTKNLIDSEGVTDEGGDGGDNFDEPSLVNVDEGFQDQNPHSVDENGLRRLGGIPDKIFRGNDEIEGPRVDQRRHIDHKSIDSLDGTSNYYSESSHGNGKQLENGYSGSQFDNLEFSGDDRTELLRKIDELKDQLSRSSMADKHLENNPHHLGNVHNHHYSDSEDWVSESSSGKYRPFMQYPYPDHPSAPTSYMNQYAESSAYMNMHATGGSHFRWTSNIADNHLKNLQNVQYIASADRFSDRPTLKNRPFMQHPLPDQYPAPASLMNHYAEPSAYMNMHPPHRLSGDIADRPIENNHRHLRIVHDDPYKSSEDWFSDTTSGKNRPTMQYPFPDHHLVPRSHINRYAEPSAYMSMHSTGGSHNFHPPKNIRSRAQVVHNPDQRFLNVPHNASSYDYENQRSLALLDYGPRATNMPQVQSENLQFHARVASEIDSEMISPASDQLPRLQPKFGSQHCRSIGGGAPFITCKNCFQPLQVPKRVMVQDSMQKKMRCGSCSTVIVFDISSNNFLVSIPEAKESTVVAGNDNIKPIEDNKDVQGHANRASLTFSFEDYDHSGYDFQSMDREPIHPLTNQQVFAESAGMKSIHSTSSYTPEEVAIHDPLVATERSSSPTESSMKGKPPPPPTGSSLQEYFEYSNKYHRGKHFEKGHRGSDQKSLMSNLTAAKENCRKDAPEATEMELSSNEFGNTESSLESGVPRKESGQLRINKAAEAFSNGYAMESFKDSKNYSLQDGHDEDNVTVNGHLIPNQLIKKAEKLAGPIQPGNYWYDFRAGFWGVYGGPCLGIIPPSIEEFKYTMPENCAGGNTSIYVNGRELHQKDLNLLVRRGLPEEKNRYYNIKISGKVIDEMTGEVLDSLGKLAPTVSRVKRGYGMKAPKQQHES